jgi:hypothetical protein
MYFNVKQRRVRVTIVPKYYLFRVCVALVIQMKSACAVLYYHLLPVWCCHIFHTLSLKRNLFRGKKIEYKMWFLISLQFCLKDFSF